MTTPMAAENLGDIHPSLKGLITNSKPVLFRLPLENALIAVATGAVADDC